MQSTPIKVGIVNYLNTKPLLFGLQKLHDQKIIDLILDYPANVADALINNIVDIGLVPIASLPHIPNSKIISNYCIASNRKVASVCLFSEVPMHEIKSVMLDYQSRTSVQLVQILFRHLWKQEVQYVAASEKYMEQISNTQAGIIIGDRALENLDRYKYVYDLAEAWIELTNLPFVFAAWVSTKIFSNEFIQLFEKANAEGFQNISFIVKQQNFKPYDLNTYYTKNICYQLDAEKHQSIEMFLNYIK
jgi:chorismate dehydratase